MIDGGPSGMRSVLMAPANHARRAEKAFLVNADCVVLDLEDSVPPREKTAARTAALEALGRKRTCPGFVRINAPDSPWMEEDLSVIVGSWLDGVMAPKVETADQVRGIDQRLSRLETSAGLAPGVLHLIPLIETARGVANVDSIASAGPRVRLLAFGGADYALDLDLHWSFDEGELAYARARLAHASRVANIEPPIDTPIVQLRDTERMRMSADNARRMGFQGKLCIHPDQVTVCNQVFAPDAAEVEKARAIVTAFDAVEASGYGTIQIDGALVDYPIAQKARKILALAGKLAARRARSEREPS